MHVHIVDPSAYTPPTIMPSAPRWPPAGARVELYTSRFAYGPAPEPEGYERRELFYRPPLVSPMGRAGVAC